MQYLFFTLIFICILFILLRATKQAELKQGLSHCHPPLAESLDNRNRQHKTNFCATYQIKSKIYFGFYRNKLYFHDIGGVSEVMDHNQIKTWKVVNVQNDSFSKRYRGVLIIETNSKLLPLIKIHYKKRDDAQKDLKKLDAFLQRMRVCC